MAKLTPVIFDEPANLDGTWNVKIRVGHKSKSAYIGTDEFVSKKDITASREIKPRFIISNLSDIISKYNKILNDKKHLLPGLTHLQVKSMLEDDSKFTEVTGEVKHIKFLEFCKNYIDTVKVEGTASILRTAYLRLNDYLDGRDISANHLTSSFLKSYEQYLRKPSSGLRLNNGEMKLRHFDALDNTGVNVHMSSIRRLHNFAKEEYNDEEIGQVVISINPFKKFKIADQEIPADRDYSASQIRQVRDCEVKAGSRAELARDVWMLSFYLCGMNAADLYKLTGKEVDRLNYNRKKTENRRLDKAFVSIKLTEEAQPLFDKYAGKLQVMYSKDVYLNFALHKGCQSLRKILGDGFQDLDTYSARHSFASIAANECGYPIESVARALNHDNGKHKVTHRYVRKSWDIIDEIQRSVTSLISG